MLREVSTSASAEAAALRVPSSTFAPRMPPSPHQRGLLRVREDVRFTTFTPEPLHMACQHQHGLTLAQQQSSSGSSALVSGSSAAIARDDGRGTTRAQEGSCASLYLLMWLCICGVARSSSRNVAQVAPADAWRSAKREGGARGGAPHFDVRRARKPVGLARTVLFTLSVLVVIVCFALVFQLQAEGKRAAKRQTEADYDELFRDIVRVFSVSLETLMYKASSLRDKFFMVTNSVAMFYPDIPLLMHKAQFDFITAESFRSRGDAISAVLWSPHVIGNNKRVVAEATMTELYNLSEPMKFWAGMYDNGTRIVAAYVNGTVYEPVVMAATFPGEETRPILGQSLHRTSHVALEVLPATVQPEPVEAILLSDAGRVDLVASLAVYKSNFTDDIVSSVNGTFADIRGHALVYINPHRLLQGLVDGLSKTKNLYISLLDVTESVAQKPQLATTQREGRLLQCVNIDADGMLRETCAARLQADPGPDPAPLAHVREVCEQEGKDCKILEVAAANRMWAVAMTRTSRFNSEDASSDVVHDMTVMAICLLSITLIGSLGALRLHVLDDTMHRMSAENQRMSRRRAEQESRERRNLLGYLSHELRNPLHALLSQADKEENAEMWQYGMVMTNALDKIVEVIQLEEGTATENSTDVDLRNLLNDMMRVFKHDAAGMGVQFSAQIDEDLTPIVRTDVQFLKRILQTLVDNALQFSPAGNVRVEVATKSEESVLHMARNSVTRPWVMDSSVKDRAAKGAAAEDSDIAGTNASCSCFLWIRVDDDGIGIPPQHMPRLFDAFERRKLDMMHSRSGTGLSLAVVRRMLDLMGGKIIVKSRQGTGTTATVYWPVSLPPLEFPDEDDGNDEVDNADENGNGSSGCSSGGDEVHRSSNSQHDSRRVSRSSVKGRHMSGVEAAAPTLRIRINGDGSDAAVAKPVLRMLVVDDVAVNRKLLRKMLTAGPEAEQAPFAVDVHEATDGVDALCCVTQSSTQFSAVFMDVVMPNMDGIECTKRLRSHGYMPPIIGVTANVLDTDRMQCIAAGMDVVLSKPFTRDKLWKTLSSHVRRTT